MLSFFKKVIIGLSLVSSSLFAGGEQITLSERNVIVLRGEVNDQSVAKVSLDILKHESNEIYLYISSPGGSVFAGMQLINVLKGSGKKVHCIASVAASMAFIILQACDTRYVMESSILMQHVASYSVRGNAPNNVSMVKFLEGMLLDIDRMQAKRLGMEVNEFRKKTRDDWWLFGNNAVREKAADKVAKVMCDKSLSTQTYVEKVRSFIFLYDVTWSKCPLIEDPVEIKVSEFSPRRTIETKQDQNIFNAFLKSLYTRQAILEMMRGK
jgi:ATP-dependent Clp protease protease subunit